VRILRSFPQTIPPDRAYVSDGFQRLPVTMYDHWQLGSYNEDILLLEWDIAVSPEQLEVFCRFIFDHGTDRVCVAPYRLYPKSTGFTTPVWAHRKTNGTPFLYTPWVEYGEPYCNLFGFGMTYFPQEIVRAYLKDSMWQPHDRRLTDTNFSMWHYSKVEKCVPICWGVSPVHLHYEYSEELVKPCR
jgi:hypothetical protein